MPRGHLNKKNPGKAAEDVQFSNPPAPGPMSRIGLEALQALRPSDNATANELDALVTRLRRLNLTPSEITVAQPGADRELTLDEVAAMKVPRDFPIAYQLYFPQSSGGHPAGQLAAWLEPQNLEAFSRVYASIYPGAPEKFLSHALTVPQIVSDVNRTIKALMAVRQ